LCDRPSACRLTGLLSPFGDAECAFHGLADVVAGRGLPVFRAWRPSGSGLAGPAPAVGTLNTVDMVGIVWRAHDTSLITATERAQLIGGEQGDFDLFDGIDFTYA